MKKATNKKANKATVVFTYEASATLRKDLYDAGLPAQAEQSVAGEFTENQLAQINIVPFIRKNGELDWVHGIAPTRLEVALRPVIAGKGFFGSYDNSVFVSNELLTAEQAFTIQSKHFQDFLKAREVQAAEKALAETLAFADFVEFMADPALRATDANWKLAFKSANDATLNAKDYESFRNEALERAKQDEREAIETARALREAQEATEVELATAKAAQVAEWVELFGTKNQKERLAAGVLPQAEIRDEIKEQAFACTIQEYLPLYASILPADVKCLCEYQYETCNLDFQSRAASSVSAEAWKVKTKLETLFPDAVVEVRDHIGERSECEASLICEGVRVKLTVGAFTFSREFAV